MPTSNSAAWRQMLKSSDFENVRKVSDWWLYFALITQTLHLFKDTHANLNVYKSLQKKITKYWSYILVLKGVKSDFATDFNTLLVLTGCMGICKLSLQFTNCKSLHFDI